MTWLGAIAPEGAVDVVLAMLREIAALGPQARAGDLLHSRGVDALRQQFGIARAPAPERRPPAQMIGPHQLHDASLAVGIALPFGHAEADTLAELAPPRRAARRARVSAGARPCADADRRVAGARARSCRCGRRARLHRRCRRSPPADRGLPGCASLRVGLHRGAQARRCPRPAARGIALTARDSHLRLRQGLRASRARGAHRGRRCAGLRHRP